jgi:hypothetical protein
MKLSTSEDIAMHIQVLKRKTQPVKLLVEFNRCLNKHNQPLIMCRGLTPTGKKVFGYSKIDGYCSTSKAFGEWLEKAIQYRLFHLAGRCGWVKIHHETFSSDGDLHGLVFDKITGKVSFEPRVGMQFIRKILGEIGVYIDVHWDAVNERITHIELVVVK